ARFLSCLSLLGDQRTRRNAGFVDIQSAATFIHDSHNILLLRHHAEDVGSVESPSRAPRSNLGIAQLRPKADNSWCHYDVQIKLAVGLAVATAAPSKGRSPCREMAGPRISLRPAVSGSFFMIRGVSKTWGTSYQVTLKCHLAVLPLCRKTGPAPKASAAKFPDYRHSRPISARSQVCGV